MLSCTFLVFSFFSLAATSLPDSTVVMQGSVEGTMDHKGSRHLDTLGHVIG